MKKQTIVWTALPNGSDDALAPGATLRLSAFVAPRLWNDDPTVTEMALAAFPDWLDWPALVAQATWQVEIGGATLPATVRSAAPRSDLWRALFKSDTLVFPFRFEDLTGAVVQSFPAATIHETLKETYRRAATDPAYGAGRDLPPNEVLLRDPDLGAIAEPVRPEPPFVPLDPDRGPVNIDEPGPGPEPGPTPEPEPEPGPGPLPGPEGCRRLLAGCGCMGLLLLPLLLLRRLLRALGSPMAPPPVAAQTAAFQQLQQTVSPTTVTSQPLPAPETLEERYDFHQMVSLLGDYPNLLRYLGLVVDLDVTLPAALPPATGTVRLLPTLPMGDPVTHYRPRTHYRLADGTFQARPRPGSDLNDGLLRLDDPRFDVHQVDVAGGGIKLQNTATTVLGVHSLGEWPANAPAASGLPALQTAGISVVRNENGEALRDSFRRAYALNGALAAEDGSPHPPAAEGVPIPPSDELFADDLVRGYRWDVWDDRSGQWRSLCQRLGDYRFLAPEGGGAPIELLGEADEGFVQASTTESLAPSATRVLRTHDSLMTWDGWSLVASRPGKTIQPDHDVSEPKNPVATQFKMESSFRAAPGSLPRLRVGYHYSLRARVADLAGNSPFVPGTPPFQLSPPERTAPAAFRRFEPVSPPPLMLRAIPQEGESLERIVVRSAVTDSAATIALQQSERHLVPPKTSQRMAEWLGHFDGSPAMRRDQAGYDLAAREAGSTTHRYDPATGTWVQLPDAEEHKDAAQQRTYWLQTGESFDITYLPDPYARGVLLLGLPGMASADEVIEPGGTIVNKLPFDGAWPDLHPIRLRLVGLAAGAAPAQPSWDGVGRVLTVELPQGERAEVRVSSYFEAADIERMGVWGWVEEAPPPDLALLKASAVQGRSWLHLPFRTLTLVHAVQQPLEIPSLSALAIQPARPLGDSAITLRGQLDLDAKSTSKVDLWAEWEDPHDDPAKPTFDPTTDLTRQRMHVGELKLPEAATDPFDFSALRHALGDTKYHRVSYTPIATTRFREYFPQGTPADDLLRPLPGSEAPIPHALDVPNATRPDAARPLYVLPIFRWETAVAGDVTTRRRIGGGLRVYLERPWFSSGAGELLGVVARPADAPFAGEEAEALRKVSSEWGRDPLWNAGHVAPLALPDLLDPTATATGLSLAEIAGQAVEVAGYAPRFDADRALWACDIPFEVAGRYFPFVRLALARFQPISVAGAHLSRVVLAEYAQLLPHRTVEYDTSALAATGVARVRLSGPAYDNGEREQSPIRTPFVIVRAERRSHAGSDPLGWEPVSMATLPLVQALPEECVWEGEIRIEAPLPSPLRISVYESEGFDAERGERPDVAEWLFPATSDGMGDGLSTVGTNMRLPRALRSRVTFADALDVP